MGRRNAQGRGVAYTIQHADGKVLDGVEYALPTDRPHPSEHPWVMADGKVVVFVMNGQGTMETKRFLFTPYANNLRHFVSGDTVYIAIRALVPVCRVRLALTHAAKTLKWRKRLWCAVAPIEGSFMRGAFPCAAAGGVHAAVMFATWG